ncbi:hypothetical protein DL95DRAFT_371459 [Leptodontidium sp. 2 PMI_412]|nr:hypothetical protein DL95DRAFT_371459 [Leptodontidium sp. 2 PMI_412]
MAAWSPSDIDPSSEGHGTLEILEVIKLFEAHEIPCCVVGISALKYFGAWRMRRDWELCVPTELAEKACSLLKSAPHHEKYVQCDHDALPQVHSLLHTFPRFKMRGYNLYFDIFPAEDCHFACTPLNFEWSLMGIPYPKLAIFAQSLLDTLDMVGLCDLIDGMNLTDEWGDKNLDLTGTNDVSWALAKNENIRASVPLTMGSFFFEVDEGPLKTRELWEEQGSNQTETNWRGAICTAYHKI